MAGLYTILGKKTGAKVLRLENNISLAVVLWDYHYTGGLTIHAGKRASAVALRELTLGDDVAARGGTGLAENVIRPGNVDLKLFSELGSTAVCTYGGASCAAHHLPDA